MQPIQTNIYNNKIIIGIILMFVSCIAALLMSRIVILYGYDFKIGFITSRILYCLIVILMICYAVKIEKSKFLIWQEIKRNAGFYVITIISVLAIVFIGSMIIGYLLLHVFHISDYSPKGEKLFNLLRENHWLIYVSAITAGVTEELLFRGYLIPRLQSVFKSNIGAIIISSLLFGLIHFGYGTVKQVIVPIYIGLVFAIFYQRYKNVKILIICHTLIDLYAFIDDVYIHH